MKDESDRMCKCPSCGKVTHGDYWKCVGRSLTGSDLDRFECPKCGAISDWECA